MKNCLFCARFIFDPGLPEYSEWTPGSPAHIGCGLDLWDWEQCTTADDYRACMLMAKTCNRYNPIPKLDKENEKA